MDSQHQDNYYIFTGGPGAGKTSVLNHLRALGYHTVEEVARNIIQEQQRIGGNATHTGDQTKFTELMLQASIHNYQQMQHINGPVFFDRGIPGLYGYAIMTTGSVPTQIQQAVRHYRYHQTVFLFPPWKEIYINDTERTQDFDEAVLTYEQLKDAHKACHYNICEVPNKSIEERAQFILSNIETK